MAEEIDVTGLGFRRGMDCISVMVLEDIPISYVLNVDSMRKLLEDVTRKFYPIGDRITVFEELDGTRTWSALEIMDMVAEIKVWNHYLVEQTKWLVEQ